MSSEKTMAVDDLEEVGKVYDPYRVQLHYAVDEGLCHTELLVFAESMKMALSVVEDFCEASGMKDVTILDTSLIYCDCVIVQRDEKCRDEATGPDELDDPIRNS